MTKPKAKAKSKPKPKPRKETTTMAEKEDKAESRGARGSGPVHDFLASDRKITELSRVELVELMEDRSCPEFMKTHISSEIVRRITSA